MSDTVTVTEIPTQAYRDSIADLRAEIHSRLGTIAALTQHVDKLQQNINLDTAQIKAERERIALAEALISHLTKRADLPEEPTGDGWDTPLPEAWAGGDAH